MLYIDPKVISGYILDCAQKNQDQDIDYYFEVGGNARTRDDDGRNAAHHFAMRGNLRAINLIVSCDLYAFECKDNFGATPLMYMAERGHMNLLPFITQRVQLLAMTDNAGRSVAGIVAAQGDIDTVLESFLPICPEIRFQKVVRMVMQSEVLAPVEKLKAIRKLTNAGFDPIM